ncbi:MAG: hypothetical protein D6725_08195 [Planctomycetota bacterium]|nr:MAG: hypothetical protein D6725_08195 [Planctomycetota bacterium]
MFLKSWMDLFRRRWTGCRHRAVSTRKLIARSELGRRRGGRRAAGRGMRTRVGVELLERRTLLSAFVVNTYADGVDAAIGDGIAADGDGNVSLRAAIQEANARDGMDFIVLPAGVYTLSVLGGQEDAAAGGDLDINDDLQILGAGSGQTIIDANGIDRIFDVDRGVAFQLSGVTLRNGVGTNGGAILSRGDLVLDDVVLFNNTAVTAADSVGGAIAAQTGSVTIRDSIVDQNAAAVHGGGIYAQAATVTLTNVTVRNNQAQVDGGGLSFFESTVTITDSAIVDNAAGRDGGGISNDNSTLNISETSIARNDARNGGGISNVGNGSVTIDLSTIEDNHAAQFGGGIENFDDGSDTTASLLMLTNSTVRGNSADFGGGGIDTDNARTALVGVTVSGNVSAVGGGLNNFGAVRVELIDVTVSGNRATDSGGGMANRNGSSTSVVSSTFTLNDATNFGGGIAANAVPEIGHTIIAGNTAGAAPDISGAVLSNGFNFLGDPTGSTGIVNGANGNRVGTAASPLDPMLGPLADNGGPTQTHLPRPGSPVIDAGAANGVPVTDQRGVDRIVDGNSDGVARADIGAVELEAAVAHEFVVDATADRPDAVAGDGDARDGLGRTTLRAAVEEANASPGKDRIVLPAGTFRFARPDVDAAVDENTANTGDLDVLESLIIQGAGADRTIIDANRLGRIFHVFPGVTLELHDLTLINGEAEFGGAIFNSGGTVLISDGVLRDNRATGDADRSAGGAIASDAGFVTLQNVSVVDNTAQADGGGLAIVAGGVSITGSELRGNTARDGGGLGTLAATVEISGTAFEQNQARRRGGGAFFAGDGTVSVDLASFVQNTAATDGGGMYVGGGNVAVTRTHVRANAASSDGGGIAQRGGTLNLYTSTVESNSAAADGGGLVTSSATVVGNSTFSGNHAAHRGGALRLDNAADATVLSVTIAENEAAVRGGGVHVASEARLVLGNTIIALNTAPAGRDVWGKVTTHTRNLIGIVNGAALDAPSRNLTGDVSAPLDPMLGPLADNGGPTPTHALLPGSPAIDAAEAGMGAAGDQRGVERFFDGDTDLDFAADIGAFEFDTPTVQLPRTDAVVIGRVGPALLVVDGATSSVIWGSPVDNIASLRIVGTDGDDTIRLDFSGGEVVPRGGLFLDGGGQATRDRVFLTGSAVSEVGYARRADGWTVTVGSASLDVRGVEEFRDVVPAAARRWTGSGGFDHFVLMDDATAGDDRSLIKERASRTVFAFADPTASLSIDGGADDDLVRLAGVDLLFSAAITVRGGDGADRLDAHGLANAVMLLGGAGDDTLLGGGADDSVSGEAGDDLLYGNGGDDRVWGGAGKDTVSGGPGQDMLNGQGGWDMLMETGLSGTVVLRDDVLSGAAIDTLMGIERAKLAGGAGNDVLDATQFSGPVRLLGQGGNDTLIGGRSRDVLLGGDGDDRIDARATVTPSTGGGKMPADFADGGAGDDTLIGSAGADVLRGGPGRDRIYGGAGDDRLSGGDGADFLNGQGGMNMLVETDIAGTVTLTDSGLSDGSGASDTLQGVMAATLAGGSGADAFDASAFSGSVRLIGRGGDDSLIGGPSADVLIGGEGDDRLEGRAGDDTLYGGAGHDSLVGQAARDRLDGGPGNDTLQGGDGNDILLGRDGNDRLEGGDGDDGLAGGRGHDMLSGNAGDDTLIGAEGNDTLRGGAGRDIALGGDGDDNVSGQGGQADTVAGGAGSDTLGGDAASEIDEVFTFAAEWVDRV